MALLPATCLFPCAARVLSPRDACVSSQDYMLAYSLRKYAGVRSYVVPMDLTDSETWGNVDVEWKMQRQVGLLACSRGVSRRTARPLAAC